MEWRHLEIFIAILYVLNLIKNWGFVLYILISFSVKCCYILYKYWVQPMENFLNNRPYPESLKSISTTHNEYLKEGGKQEQRRQKRRLYKILKEHTYPC